MLKSCLAAALAMGAAVATACTGMYAGRKASADGTVQAKAPEAYMAATACLA